MVIRIGIFTGIIALVFSAFSPIMAESQTDSLGLFSLIAGILVYVSLGCFLYTFVVYLYRVLFGGEQSFNNITIKRDVI